MEQFVATISQLPDAVQDEYAAHFLSELEDDSKWDASFAKSQDVLSAMAAEALIEHRSGDSKPLMENGEFTSD